MPAQLACSSQAELLHQYVSCGGRQRAERFAQNRLRLLGSAVHFVVYKGDVSRSLRAFHKLVQGVAQIHSHDAIHRDIKPENIFVDDGDDLVLGDFSIVFFQDGSQQRLTATHERVGSHFWMAPWAYGNMKVEAARINPTLDIYPLAKVLWSMIAGRNGFPYWECNEPDNRLDRLFPNDPVITMVHDIVANCLVRHEKECRYSTAFSLLLAVEDVIREIEIREGYRLANSTRWPCKVCGQGEYKMHAGRNHTLTAIRQGGPSQDQELRLVVSVCDHCGHAELFQQIP